MRCGYEPTSGTYYEVLGNAGSDRPLLLMIHGGGATGACFRTSLDGRPGWADQLADRHHRVVVSDWPGCGRSGNRHLVDIEYSDVVEGYRRLLRDVIGEPVIVLCHSMGGAAAWQLVEHEGDLVVGVVAVAAAHPGNLQSKADVINDDGKTITVRFPDSGAIFIIDRTRGYIYEDDYIHRQAIASSKHFPRDRVDGLRVGLVPLPPKMLLQRMGILPGLPPVTNTARFVGKPVRLVAGGEDPAHTQSIEKSTAQLLRGWGANVEIIWLPDQGVHGNGHFLFLEDNRDDVLSVVEEQIAAVWDLRPGGASRGGSNRI